MKDELCYGRIKYLSFLLLDILFLFLSNILASRIYLVNIDNYTFLDHQQVVIIMVIIDVCVSFFFNTLKWVLRRRKCAEIREGLRQVGISFVSLAVVLFCTRRGAVFSRVTIFLAYSIYSILYVSGHIVWKFILSKSRSIDSKKTAILMTTDRFVDEGLEQLKELNINVKYIYLIKNINRDEINGIPVIKRWEGTAAAICWDQLDKVFIYGLDHQMVPNYLIKACKEMGLKFNLVDYKYRIINIKTIGTDKPEYGELSFLEGKRDIPFPIRRVYWITETEAERHRGFHAHKLSCQMLFCPYGEIDIILDDGVKRTTVKLNDPRKGLILMPGLWREMIWKQSKSVLCVLASEYYDPTEYIRDYNEFLEYNRKYQKSAGSLTE